MSGYWYPIHRDRLLGSLRFRALDGNVRGFWLNLTTLARRKDGRIVRPNDRPISLEELRTELNYRRLDRVRAMMRELLEIGLVAEDARGFFLPRFASLCRARTLKTGSKRDTNEHGTVTRRSTGPSSDRPARSSPDNELGSDPGAPQPQPQPESCKGRQSYVRSGTRASGGRSPGALRAPHLKRLARSDLESTSRLLLLREQAPAGFPRGEHGTILFVACAEHALAKGDRPEALFRAMIDPLSRTKASWRFVTAADEDRARRRIREHQNGEAT